MKYLITTLLILLTHLSFAQSLSKATVNEIDRRVELEINPSIAMALLLPDGQTTYFNFGSYDKNGNPPDSLTLYEIGSVTKTFTAQLTENYLSDSLALSLSHFFPEVNNNTLAKIKLAELRNHQSGAPRLSAQFSPDNWSDPFHGYSDSLLMIELEKLRIDSAKRWSYSNFGYGLLGKTLEVSTGKSYEQLMQGLLTQAQMSHTLLYHTPDAAYPMALPTNIGTANSYWNFTGPSRYAGGLISCTQDLASYLKYQQENNSLFRDETLEGLTQTGIPNLGEEKLFYKEGWFVFKPDDKTEILLHNGGTGGFTSFVAYNKSSQTGVVILSNSVNLIDDIGLHLLYPDFQLQHPERTIAYELADKIEKGETEGLLTTYQQMKSEGYPDNVLDVYWLERYFYGQKNYQVSDQLSDIMLEVLPDDWEVLDIKGQNLEKLEKYEQALNAYQKALELDPENEKLRLKIEALSKELIEKE